MCRSILTWLLDKVAILKVFYFCKCHLHIFEAGFFVPCPSSSFPSLLHFCPTLILSLFLSFSQFYLSWILIFTYDTSIFMSFLALCEFLNKLLIFWKCHQTLWFVFLRIFTNQSTHKQINKRYCHLQNAWCYYPYSLQSQMMTKMTLLRVFTCAFLFIVSWPNRLP